jgi:hypothetical protein
METIYDILDEKIQRKHFDAITKNEWFSGSVIKIYDYSNIYLIFLFF